MANRDQLGYRSATGSPRTVSVNYAVPVRTGGERTDYKQTLASGKTPLNFAGRRHRPGPITIPVTTTATRQQPHGYAWDWVSIRLNGFWATQTSHTNLSIVALRPGPS